MGHGVLYEVIGLPGPTVLGDVIVATDGHPFWVSNLGSWVDTVALVPGMRLKTSSGTWVQVSVVQAWIQSATVHNLTVQSDRAWSHWGSMWKV